MNDAYGTFEGMKGHRNHAPMSFKNFPMFRNVATSLYARGGRSAQRRISAISKRCTHGTATTATQASTRTFAAWLVGDSIATAGYSTGGIRRRD
jgi:hypothetical protein